MWHMLASEGGYGRASKGRDILAAPLELADRSEAERRAQKCRTYQFSDCS